VIVDPIPCKYGIPTAFSPNDDGINDFFKVRSSCPLVDFELKIINRWGQEVFATTDQENGWDGTMNGRKCPPDVFAYCVILRCPNKEEKETILGDVSLVR
jgi:gliding motility-associated-like protein